MENKVLPLLLGPSLMDLCALLLPLVLGWNMNSSPEATTVSLFIRIHLTLFGSILMFKKKKKKKVLVGNT